jgi:hypothetical protein
MDFRANILSKGDSDDPAELYKKFMGREPDPSALLVRSGLAWGGGLGLARCSPAPPVQMEFSKKEPNGALRTAIPRHGPRVPWPADR